jgi:hypothetical protein
VLSRLYALKRTFQAVLVLSNDKSTVASLIDCINVVERKDGAVQPALLVFFYHGTFIWRTFYHVLPEILPGVTNIRVNGLAKRLGLLPRSTLERKA